ncbi:hypothetical protein PN471_08525 [Aphanizomenon sp. CS-733/32]|uniref:hypothetical protein n=1 Tax=Aphanizomenon sp. CS-733/32 TaxID=3021715 RepID=UPI00232C9A3C|nr:hypothetical protein [Aphanizomenon sp. CS-733/32]MDB9308682.1 hypothetical protein [Aphanizomenon sp. CS-733/32]
MSVNSDEMFFGTLTNQEYDVEQEKVELVRKHISKFDEFLPSQKMIDRLQNALDLGQKICNSDASFYFHELKEAELMEKGYDWYTAHPMAIAHYGVSPYSLYHPEVIKAYPEDFNRNWRKAWGIDS